jgi:hypothetical protein
VADGHSTSELCSAVCSRASYEHECALVSAQSLLLTNKDDAGTPRFGGNRQHPDRDNPKFLPNHPRGSSSAKFPKRVEEALRLHAKSFRTLSSRLCRKSRAVKVLQRQSKNPNGPLELVLLALLEFLDRVRKRWEDCPPHPALSPRWFQPVKSHRIWAGGERIVRTTVVCIE